MKKPFTIILVTVMTLFFVTGCVSQNSSTENQNPSSTTTTSVNQSTSNSDGYDELRALFAKIPKLDKTVKLNISTTAGVYHCFFNYLADELGALESVGIDANMVNFPNGPLQVEAISAGSIDCGGYGIGGILSGSVNSVTTLIDYRTDEAVVQKFFVKADSSIIDAGLNEFGFYGTADTWRGATVYCPGGTTLQYLLGTAMEKVGLTLDDLNVVYTDVNNIFPILQSGKGDAWGLWNMQAYSSILDDNYVEAINANSVGIHLMAATVVGRSVLDDPEKFEAVKRWYACQEAVVMWINESDENMELAIQAMYDWCQDEGVDVNFESIGALMKDEKGNFA